MNDNSITLNTDHLTPPTPTGDIWGNRAAAYHMYDAPGVPKCSIVVTAYNRLEKTKYCVECILKYTQNVSYELILIDHGSSDGTYEYFQSVPYNEKTIVKITKNMGLSYPWTVAKETFRGKYLVIISNDVYVTQNWLSNIMTCYESDPRIGFVLPVSSNVSNLQEVNINFNNTDDMQKKAAAYNKSDPSKWEERIRLVDVIRIYSRHVIDTVGIGDAAFVHDFIEDDLAVRLRRAGYKLMLCKDTWIHHDHDFRNMEDKDPAAFQASLESGRRIYQEKYHGIDAWDDINNFEFELLTPLDKVPLNSGELTVLACEPRCGTPVLEIRNRLRRRGINDVVSYAFTAQAKYYLDLQTVAGHVTCDRVDYIQDAFADNMFDIIAFCEPINIYPAPITLLQRLYNFLKPGGVLTVKLRNTDGYNALLRSGGLGGNGDPDMPAALSPHEAMECLKLFGGRNVSLSHEFEPLSDADQKTLMKLLKGLNPNASNDVFKKLLIKNYILTVTKG
jgi:GT2 family glycosyltransferase